MSRSNISSPPWHLHGGSGTTLLYCTLLLHQNTIIKTPSTTGICKQILATFHSTEFNENPFSLSGVFSSIQTERGPEGRSDFNRRFAGL
jgi:hypothetical protein